MIKVISKKKDFKKNCNDFKNSKVISLLKLLK